MNSNDNILDELKEVSAAVANINRRNVYSVPSGYFLNLAERLLTFVKQNSEQPLLTSTELPYQVPHGYFDGLSASILSKVKQQSTFESDVTKELSEVAPLLNTISKKAVYNVPEGYFDNLVPRTNETKTKVVSINRASRFVRYAAAAAITGLVAIGGIFYANNDSDSNTASTTAASNIQQVNQLSDDEIVTYLNNHPAATDVTIVSKEKDLSKYTKELSDEEIESFLEEEGEVVDNQEG